MATRPETRYAVTIQPAQGEAIVVLFTGAGSANAALSQLWQFSDAEAVMHGAVNTLPMIVSAPEGFLFESDDDSNVGSWAWERMSDDFTRLMPGKVLIELRDFALTRAEQSYWTATALWVSAPVLDAMIPAEGTAPRWPS